MAERSTTVLPPSTGESLLRLGFNADRPTKIAISMNGQQLDAFDASGEVQREWHVLKPNDGPNTLEIVTDRDRAIRVRFLSWAIY